MSFFCAFKFENYFLWLLILRNVGISQIFSEFFSQKYLKKWDFLDAKNTSFFCWTHFFVDFSWFPFLNIKKFTIINMKCPHCSRAYKSDGVLSVCDNQCGTIYCPNCKRGFYMDRNKQITKGHHPYCGLDA